MRKRFTDEQNIAILKQSAAGKSTRDRTPEHGISPNTLHSWRRRLGGMEVIDAHPFKRQNNHKPKPNEAFWSLRKAGSALSAVNQ
jgi:transposase-like protein